MAKTLVLRCNPCRDGLHMRCLGRDAPCRCMQCQGRAIRADARLYTQPIVAELLALLVQRDDRRRRITAAGPVGQGRRGKPLVCAAPGCTRYVFGSPYGRRRLTCSDACRSKMNYLLRRERAGSAEQEIPELVSPAGLDCQPPLALAGACVAVPRPDGGWDIPVYAGDWGAAHGR